MTECSSKRIKLEDTESSSGGDLSTTTQFTTVSLSADSPSPSRLNKITLVPLTSPSNSPIKTVSGSPAKVSFIDSLTKKPSSATASTSQPSTINQQPGQHTKRILTITSSNGTSISPSAFASSLNGNDKIQYVKIVNSSQNSNAATSSNNPIKITSVCSSSGTQVGLLID